MSAAPQFVNTEIPRDRYGRPMIVPPGRGTKRVSYRRTTTFVGCLDDTYGLMQWKQRQTALGMSMRKDLVLAAAAADPTDKRKLNDIAEKACEHALSSASATTGTALHALTERIDRGQPLGVVPTEYVGDIEAYEKATATIEWTAIEAFRVHDEWKVAGTADRIGWWRGRLVIADIKTGSIDYPHKMAMQLAMYSRSTPYDIATDTRGADPAQVDPNFGLIIHLPAGEGRCDIHTIDIGKGWGGCLTAKKVWNWRDTKGLTELVTDPSAPAPKAATWSSVARRMESLDDLRELWRKVADRGQLDEDFRAAARQRSEELAANTTQKVS